MRKAWLWGTFGVLLAGVVASGFVPDLRLSAERRAARAEGLLGPDPAANVPKEDDARALYEAAGKRYWDGIGLLGNHFVRETVHPAPHTTGYLNAMAEATKRPVLSAWSPTNEEEVDQDMFDDLPRNIQLAAQGILARAKGEADLAAAARMAAHLAYGRRIDGTAAWAALVPSVFDAADRLKLDRSSRTRIAAAFGPAPEPLAVLCARPGIVLGQVERLREKGIDLGGWRLLRTVRQIGYLRTWRGFLSEAAHDPAHLADRLRRSEGDLRGEEEAFHYRYEDGYVLTPPAPSKAPMRAARQSWAYWAESLAWAHRRLEMER